MLYRYEPARYYGLHRIFWLVRMDDADFEVGTELGFQKAFESSEEFRPNALRTAENNRGASGCLFLKFLCFAMQ